MKQPMFQGRDTSPQAGDYFREIKNLLDMIHPRVDHSGLQTVFNDVARVFNGEYPGYRACTTTYHNQEHTLEVTLTVARLLHGAHVSGVEFSPRGPLIAVLAALFHDIGYIQKEDDPEDSGAKYTVGHEERGIEFMREYLAGKAVLDDQEIHRAEQIIRFTIMSLKPAEIAVDDEETRFLGQIMGTADLLAQMADIHYLRKLPDLYTEFSIAGVPGFASEFDLVQKTEGFWNNIARKRLEEDLAGVSAYMQPHFKARWGIDEDPYQKSIDKNLRILRAVLDNCGDDYREQLEKLSPECAPDDLR